MNFEEHIDRPQATNGGRQLVIAHKHQSLAFALMPQLEGHRKFVRNGDFHFENTAYNRRMCEENGIEVVGVKQEIWEDHIVADRPKFNPPTHYFNPMIGDWDPIEKYEHQDRAFDQFSNFQHNGKFLGALFAEMGTGKTKMAIDLINHHFCNNRIDAVIVFAKKGVHKQWATDVEEDGAIVRLSPIKAFTQVDLEHKAFIWGPTPKERKIPLSMLGPDDRSIRWFFFTFEAHTSKVARNLIEKIVEAYGDRLAFLGDETHKLKTPSAKRTEYATNIAHKCRVRIILTGTPLAKNLLDEYSQFRVLDPTILGHKYVTTFRNEFCVMGGFENKQIVGSKNLEKFKQITAPFVFRITKSECLDLPEKQYRTIDFDMSPQQKAAIKQIKENETFFHPSGGIIYYENALSILNAIQQISNGFLSFKEHDTIFFDNPRLEALKELAEDNESKIVVWAKFHQDIANIMSALGDVCVPYYGPIPEKARERNKERFISDPTVQYIALTAATGAEGLDGLQKASNTAVYYSNTYNSIERWQSEDRIHRIGMGDKALYIDLIAKGSIDRRVLANLRNKKALADLVLDVGRGLGLKTQNLL